MATLPREATCLATLAILAATRRAFVSSMAAAAAMAICAVPVELGARRLQAVVAKAAAPPRLQLQAVVAKLAAVVPPKRLQAAATVAVVEKVQLPTPPERRQVR